MKKICIDCGTHLGQGLKDISNQIGVDASWIVHSFEANPCVYKQLEESGQRLNYVHYHNLAVSNTYNDVIVNVETPPGEGETGMGTSIISLDQWGAGIKNNFKTFYTVKAIRLANFIKENFNLNEDFIAMKIDIEGSEYDVLEDMEDLGVLKHIDFLAVEFHSRMFSNIEEILVRENKIRELIASHNIRFVEWY